jgi:hypothetical protein
VRKDLSECHIWARTQIEYNERVIRQLKETEERQRLERIENYDLQESFDKKRKESIMRM